MPRSRSVNNADCGNNARTASAMADTTLDLPIGENYLQVKHYGLTQAQFDELHGRAVSEHDACSRLRAVKRACRCSRDCCLETLNRRLPVVKMLKEYRFKEYIMGDVISGLSLGFLHIPQGLGYAVLASLPPIIGLYTSFFSPMIYFFFGTAQHVSMGTMAISSLVIASAVEKGAANIHLSISSQSNSTFIGYEETNGNNYTGAHGNNTDGSVIDFGAVVTREKVSIAMSMSFLAGLILMVMSLLRLGFWAAYISDPFISGYVSGATIHVVTLQLKHMLGVTVGSYTGPLSYFYLLRDIILQVPQTNVVTLGMSVASCTILVLVKKFINERFSSKLKVPVPVDMIVVIIGILVSYFCHLDEDYDVKIVKTVPQGFPEPTLPSVVHMRDYFMESLVLALLGYVMVYMMARLFSCRHNYAFDAPQEMFATGISSCLGAFFLSLAPSTSPARCFLMEATGGRTALTHVVSGCLVLLTLCALAPLLRPLPICILASLIVVSCIPLIEHFRKCAFYRRTCVYDLAVWTVTLTSTVLVGVDMGIFIGVGFSFVVSVYRTQRPYLGVLRVARSDGTLIDTKRYPLPDSKDESSDVRILRFEAPLYFATNEIFKQEVFHATVNPISLAAMLAKKRKRTGNRKSGPTGDGDERQEGEKTAVADAFLNGSPSGVLALELDTLGTGDVQGDSSVATPLARRGHGSGDAGDGALSRSPASVRVVIIDCGAIPYADTSGVLLLAWLHTEYQRAGVHFALARINETVRGVLYSVPACRSLVSEALYPSVHDAIKVLSKAGSTRGAARTC